MIPDKQKNASPTKPNAALVQSTRSNTNLLIFYLHPTVTICSLRRHVENLTEGIIIVEIWFLFILYKKFKFHSYILVG